jgi:hypothetical protein
MAAVQDAKRGEELSVGFLPIAFLMIPTYSVVF